MPIDFIGLAVLLVLLALFGWLAWRAWRTRKAVIKWPGAILAVALTIAAAVLLGAALLGYWKLNREHDNPVPQFTVALTPENLARGERFDPYCGGCHAPEAGAPMTGRDFLGADAPPVGTFYAPNLTPVHLEAWSDGEIVRAIREGIHRNGRSLLIMPSNLMRHLSDSDVQAIVAYLRSLPPQGTPTPTNRLNVLGAAMINLAPLLRAQPPVTGVVEAPPPGPTAEYGAYLSSLTCDLCHGSDLLGDPDFQAPPLLGIALAWSEEEFLHFMRTGIRPDGTEVDGDKMPWEDMARFLREDDELRAVFAHMKDIAGGRNSDQE